jgi:hypothetical protein
VCPALPAAAHLCKGVCILTINGVPQMKPRRLFATLLGNADLVSSSRSVDAVKAAILCA